MNPPLERDRSPVAAAPKACSCRYPPQVADCIRTRCAPGRRALRTPAGSGAQGAIKVRSVLSLIAGSALTFVSASSARADEFGRRGDCDPCRRMYVEPLPGIRADWPEHVIESGKRPS